jgi:dTDP-4-dehydrorhamnose reductase
VAVLCAAVTSQKACQEDYATTYAINVTATVELAKRLVEAGTFVVFLSTNLVFDGSVPLVPADHPVNPQTAYGQQKAEAEQALLALAPDSVAIVRLTKVLNRGFPLFQSWIDSLRAHRPIHPFADLYLAPISLPFATAVVAQVAQQRLRGIIQASAKDDLSYAEVAYRLAEKLHLNTNLIDPVSCQTAGVTYAPRHTTLATDRLQGLGMHPPDAGQVIDQLWMPAL